MGKKPAKEIKSKTPKPIKYREIYTAFTIPMSVELASYIISEYDKLGHTYSWEKFCIFISAARVKVSELNHLISKFYQRLSDLANTHYKQELAIFLEKYERALNKKDFLKFQLSKVKLDVEDLVESLRKEWGGIGQIRRLGYSHAVNANDFYMVECFYGRKQSDIGIEYYDISSRTQGYPLTIERLFYMCNFVYTRFENASKGYADFLLAEYIEKLISENATSNSLNNESIPDFEFTKQTQKIAWLHYLGIIDAILKQCKEGETYIWSRAAKIIQSFTGINSETIRKSLEAIYQPNDGNKKNNPLTSPENKLFVAEMAAKFRLEKEK